MFKKPAILLGAHTLEAGRGGICRLARLVAKVLLDQQQVGRCRVEALTLASSVKGTIPGMRVRGSKGSRWRYVVNTHGSAWRFSHIIYDCVNMAQAHSRLPLLNRPYLTFICGVELWEEARPRWVAMAKRAKKLVAISDYTRLRADRVHGDLAHAEVCWLGTANDALPPTHRRRGRATPRVLIVSRVDDPYKGHDALIDCWHKVHQAVPDAVLTIVGGGHGLEALRQKVAASVKPGNIEVLGFVPEDQLHAMYANATLFAMPSRGEGFGLVYVEAMRHGLPVIASVHDAAQEIVLDGTTGYTVDLDCPDQLPERLICVLKDRSHSAELGEAGRQRWQEHFCYSAFKARFVPILEDFLHKE